MSHRFLRQALTVFFLLVMLWGAPREVHAQSIDVSNRSATLSTASVSLTSTVVGGVIVSVMVDSGSAELKTYLEQNAVAVIGDMSIGAGDTLDDLAHAFGFPTAQYAAFARRLFERRARLVPLVLDVNVATVQRFIAVVLSP